MKKLINPLLFFITTIFLLLSCYLLLDEPFIWPDEALYGDISRNIALNGRLGTDLLKGMIVSVENHAYWLPPLFMYTLAGWLKIFGTAIETQRYFSVILGMAFILIFYQVAKSFIQLKNRTLSLVFPLAVTFLLTIDAAFLKASRLSRPEIMVLVLVFTALLFYLKSIGSKKRQNILLFFTGLFLGLAATTHLIAICFALSFGLHLMYTHKKNLFRFKGTYIFSIAFLTPIIIWILSIYPNYDLLQNQLNLISESRSYTIPWYINVLNFPLLTKVSYFIYILLSLTFVIYSLKTKKSAYLLLSFILILTWIFVTLGEIYWYTVYTVPFAYLALMVFLCDTLSISKNNLRSKGAKIFFIGITAFLIFSNISNYLSLFSYYKNRNSYQIFTDQILENIPENKSVFLTSLPDAYFAFDKDRNKLYEYPAFFADLNDVKKVLDQTDYIIFSGFFSPDPVSNSIDQYITRNTESIKELTSPYKIMVIKLKAPELRN